MAGAVALLGWGLGMLASTPLRWRWEPAEGCPALSSVVDDSEALLDSPGSEPAAAFGRITGLPGAYALELRVDVGSRREERRLHASDCELLTRAAVLVVAITVDALATAEALPPAKTPPPSVPPPELPLPQPSLPAPARPVNRSAPEPPPRAVPPPEPRARSLRLGVAAGLGWGLGPSGTAGVEGIVGGRLGPARLEVAGYHWFSQPTTLSTATGTESALSGAWLHGCYVWSWSAVDVPLCAGVDLAAMHGRGIGPGVQPQEVRDLWVALAAGPGLEFRPTRRLALSARIEPFFSVRRPAMFLLVDGQPQQTFRMPSFGLRVLLGPFFRFGSKETRPGGAR